MKGETMAGYVQRITSDQALLWKGRAPLLSRLDIELTERCNNNCIHCYINVPADDPPARSKELATKQIQEILSEAASLGCLTVRFTGGEPLVRDDFEALYLFARRLGLTVALFTNATLITPHLAQLFARIPPREAIEVTVYGMKPASYEAVTTNPGSYERARHGINLLLNNKVPFMVKGALLPPMKGEMEEFETWASALPGTDEPPSYSLFLQLRGRRDNEEKNLRIKGLRLSPEEGLQVLGRRHEEYVRGMREFCARFTAPPGDKLFSCGAGIGSGCVDAYGTFQPCMMVRHPQVVYDLTRGSLQDALVNFFPVIRDMRAKDPAYLARCARCFLMGLCEQCPAKAWMEHGTLDTPVAYCCEIAHAEARYLGLLAPGEVAWEVKDWRERLRRFSEKGADRGEAGQAKARVCEG
ncbi:MAG: radical SAM protein [Deltaproteobacteria bacterium]|nr:radical SAM protein [Deltaproteobacteria bacterium]